MYIYLYSNVLTKLLTGQAQGEGRAKCAQVPRPALSKFPHFTLSKELHKQKQRIITKIIIKN